MKKATMRLAFAGLLGAAAFLRREQIIRSLTGHVRKAGDVVSSANEWGRSAARVGEKASAFAQALADSGEVILELADDFDKFSAETAPLVAELGGQPAESNK